MQGVNGAELQARAIQPEAQVGPYRITGMLGRGGMGRVFAATHVETGRAVALKTIARLESISLECFYEEITALRQLDHPGVVPIYESGLERGEPWYAMQLLQGPMLRELLRPSSEVPPPASSQTRPLESGRGVVGPVNRSPLVVRCEPPSHSQLLRLCCGVLDTLNYVHSRGIVHGDLKPENIFAADSAAPVLVDFGIALPFDRLRERLVLSRRAVGSAAYMAPEQVRGEVVDARADLYALGCILYECLTGFQPFVRDTVEGTLLAQLRAAPPRVSELAPSVPPAVASLVDRLLSKSRGGRPGYAHDVLDTLLRHYAVDWHRPRPAPACYLYRPALVGREQERQQLLDRLDDAFSGQGSRLVLTGPPGIGKTRLLLDLADLAEGAGVATFKAEGFGLEQQRSARPLSSILPLLSEFADLANSSAESDAALKSAIEGALALANGQRAAPIASEDLVAQLTRALVLFCRSRPVLLAADDPAACDGLTRDFLSRVAQVNFESFPLLLAFSAPDAEACSPLFEEMQVSPLTEDQVRVVIESTLSVELAPRRLVETAYQASRGNPQVVCQYLRALIDGKVLQRTSRQGWYVDWDRAAELISVPHARPVQDWFRHRLARLAQPEHRLALTVAVLGESFEIAVLEELAASSSDEIARLLGSLRRTSIIRLESTGAYRFEHREFRELLLATLTPPERQSIHASVVQVLERRAPPRREEAYVLATHLRGCGDHARAAQCFELAANQLRAENRHWEVFHALECAAEEIAACSPSLRFPGAALRVHEDLGDAALLIRRLERAGAAYYRALAEAPVDPLVLARLHRKVGAAQQRESQVALGHLQLAAALLEATPDDTKVRSEWMQSRLDAMFVHYWKQETRELLNIARSIEVEIDRFGAPSQVASFHFNLAAGYMQQRRYVTGPRELYHVDKALQLYQGLGDAPRVAMCRFLRSMLLLCSGQLTGAEEGFSQLLSMGKSSASATIQLRALTYLCLVHRKQRASEPLRRLAAAALSLATEHGMPEYRGTALANLAWLSLSDGEVLECKRLAEEAQAAWTASPINYSFRWTAVLPLLAAQLQSEDWDAEGLAGLAGQLLQETQELPPHSLLAELEHLRDARTGANHFVREVAERVLTEARAHRML